MMPNFSGEQKMVQTSGKQKMKAQSQRVLPIERQLKVLPFVLKQYYLCETCGFPFQCISSDSFWNLAFVISGSYLNIAWMSTIRSHPQNDFILQTYPSTVFRRTCWKHQNLLKIITTIDALIINCPNFSEQIFLRSHQTDTFDSYFNGRLTLRQLVERAD